MNDMPNHQHPEAAELSLLTDAMDEIDVALIAAEKAGDVTARILALRESVHLWRRYASLLDAAGRQRRDPGRAARRAACARWRAARPTNRKWSPLGTVVNVATVPALFVGPAAVVEFTPPPPGRRPRPATRRPGPWPGLWLIARLDSYKC